MKLTVRLNAVPFNQRWPQIRIYNNNNLIDDCILNQSEVRLEYVIDPASANTLTIEFYNKSFGDNGVWDLDTTGASATEMQIQITDIEFDDVSVGHLISHSPVETEWTANQLTYTSQEFKDKYNKYFSNGLMTFNGRFEFAYQMPVYEFLIKAKYKLALITDRAFYSNNTELFHYEQGFANIQEIRSIINSHETDTSTSNT